MNTSLFSSLLLGPTVLPVTTLPSGHLTPCVLRDLNSSPSPLPHYKHRAFGSLCQEACALASPGQLLLLAEQPDGLGFVEPKAVPKMACPEREAGPAAASDL